MVQSRLTVRLIMIQLLLVFQVLTTDAFHSSIQLRRHDHPLRSSPTSRNSPTTLLWAAAKKGFGKTTTNPPSSKPDPAPSTTTTTRTSNPSSINSELEIVAATSVSPESSSPTTSKMNAGQRALQELRRQKIEERDQELRQVRDMIQADEQVQNSGPVAIPEKVAQRMGLRMLPFVGLPFFGGMMAFVAFWYFATYQNLQFEPTLVAASTIALLVVGLLGITYSVMSASWDPDREGSFIGWEEFQLNLQNVRDGLRRSRSNAILREKMSSLSPNEVQQALQDLDRREMKK